MTTKTIVLDINKPYYNSIVAKQGDTDSRFLLFQLYDNSISFNLTNKTVRVFAKKPDGTEVFNDLAINDTLKGICTLELTNQLLALPGIVDLELVIYSGQAKLSSIPLQLTVIESINNDNAVVSTNEYSALVEALSQVQNIDNRFADVHSSLETKVNKGEVSVYDIDKNQGKFDQSYLSDELLNQISGDTPINSTPSLKSITQDKMARPYLYAKNKNLFNKSSVTNGGYYAWETGGWRDNGLYCGSDYILVDSLTQYTLSGTGVQFCMFDIDKNYVTGYANVDTNTSFTFTTPSNVRYIRINCKLTQKDTTQLEEGNISTVYEPFGYYFDETTVLNTIPKNKLDSSLIDGEYINLFNKNDITSGKYVSYLNGNLNTNSACQASNYIELLPNTTYTISGTTDQYALYDKNKVFTRGFLDTFTFTTTSNDKYIRMSTRTTTIDIAQLEIGSTASKYATYGILYLKTTNISPKFKDEILKGVASSNVLIVNQNGSGSYLTINDAVSNSKDGNIIMVYPGVYNETVRAYSKDISIIGISKKHCILKSTDGRKAYPPLEMAKGYLSNMTIYAEKIQGATATGSLAYGIHIDDTNSKNSKLVIENCNITSDWNCALGIGTWENFILEIRNTQLYSKNTNENGALFIHNCQFANNGFQKIVLDNVRVKCSGGVSANIYDVTPSDTNKMELTVYNSIFYSEINGKNAVSINATLGDNISITDDSFGNNTAIFNK